MNLGDNRWHSKYICDKCKQEIKYIGQRGFVGINHYYKLNRGQASPYKDFDLCSNCEKKLKEWLNTQEIPTQKELISMFPVYEEV